MRRENKEEKGGSSEAYLLLYRNVAFFGTWPFLEGPGLLEGQGLLEGTGLTVEARSHLLERRSGLLKAKSGLKLE